MSEPSRKLSTDEVSALMDGLKTGDLSSSTIKDSKDVEVKVFSFGSDDLTLLGDYYALRLINERFARMVRTVFLPLLRVQPRISSFPPEVKTFEEYSSGLDAFMSLTNNRIEELRGSLLTVLPPEFVSLCTSSRYGGKLEVTETSRTEFTSTEEKIIEVVNTGVSRVLEQSWKDLTPITLKFQSREQNPQFAAFVEASDLVIVCSFVMQLPKVDSMSFDLVYPLQTLKPVSSLLRSRVQSDVVETNMNWKDRLHNAVLEIPLKVTSKLSEPDISMSKLLRFKKDDVININVEETVDFFVEDQLYFTAEMGEVKGNAAVNLKKRMTKFKQEN
ncbi:MAG: flagellar motor switch protein FliM [Rickettsiales bacterium]|nr:flagellar motor switch protein FliM [Rickettsiales bacterium]OUW73068.1 MAG: flagellar motor switch protein FliM [Rickettsiales bacterium TMED211]